MTQPNRRHWNLNDNFGLEHIEDILGIGTLYLILLPLKTSPFETWSPKCVEINWIPPHNPLMINVSHPKNLNGHKNWNAITCAGKI